MIDSLLKQLGLSSKETSIYLCITQNSRISAGKIAKLTGINRPTVYSILKELAKKELVIEDLGAEIAYYSPASRETMLKSLEYEKHALEEKRALIENIVKESEALPKSGNFSLPKIRFVDEGSLKKFFEKESDIWAQSGLAGDATWWGFQDATLLEQYPNWSEYFFRKYSGQTKIKILTNKKPVETAFKKKYSDRSDVKYLGKNSEFTATHVVFGDYILMIMTREHPYYLIEIHDRVMAHNLRESFKLLWDKL